MSWRRKSGKLASFSRALPFYHFDILSHIKISRYQDIKILPALPDYHQDISSHITFFAKVHEH